MAKESKELKDKICDAISDGMTTAQASEAFGISKVTLYRGAARGCGRGLRATRGS